MSVIGAKELKARLASSACGGYLFFGEEEHLKRVYLSRFRALVTSCPEFNVTKLVLPQDGAISVLSGEVARLPMLSDIRFVEAHGLLLHQLTESEETALLALMEDLPSDLILILYFHECDVPFEREIPRTKKKLKDLAVYQRLVECATVVNFTHPTTAELVAYYGAKLKSRGISAERELLTQLALRTGGDMTRMENESETLIALAAEAGGVLTRALLDSVLPPPDDARYYYLTDALEQCDGTRALSEYQSLRAQKNEPIPILSSVAKSLAYQLIAKEGGLTPPEAEQEYGIKAFRYQKLCRSTERVSRAHLCDCLQECTRLDRLFKSTALPADVLMTELILKICSRGV